MVRGVAVKLGVGLLVGLVVTLAARDARSGEACCAGKGKAASEGLEVIKNLAGTWLMVGEDGKATDQVGTKFRVTSGGSAVEEILFPGTDHEMVTMYHLDGDALMLTHYCALGNQPRMRAEPGGEPNKLVFKFAGAGNLKSEGDPHMHEGVITLVDANHLKAEWSLFEGGKSTGTHTLNLVRQ